MKTLFKWALGLTLLTVLVAVAATAGLIHLAQDASGVAVSVYGHEWTSDAGMDLGDLLGCLLGLGVTGVVLLVVLPLTRLLGLGLPLLIMGGLLVGGLALGLAALLGVGALLGSPLILLVLLAVWLLKPASGRRSSST